MKKRRTAAEIIGFHLCWDMRDVSETRYQRYSNPAIYVIGDDYFAAPANNAPPKAAVGMPWVEVAEYYNRKVFVAKMIRVPS